MYIPVRYFLGQSASAQAAFFMCSHFTPQKNIRIPIEATHILRFRNWFYNNQDTRSLDLDSEANSQNNFYTGRVLSTSQSSPETVLICPIDNISRCDCVQLIARIITQ